MRIFRRALLTRVKWKIGGKIIFFLCRRWKIEKPYKSTELFSNLTTPIFTICLRFGRSHFMAQTIPLKCYWRGLCGCKNLMLLNWMFFGVLIIPLEWIDLNLINNLNKFLLNWFFISLIEFFFVGFLCEEKNAQITVLFALSWQQQPFNGRRCLSIYSISASRYSPLRFCFSNKSFFALMILHLVNMIQHNLLLVYYALKDCFITKKELEKK
jgi:hypothetical protein